MTRRTVCLVSAACLVLFAYSCGAEPQLGIPGVFGDSLKVKHFQNTGTVPAFEVFEITFEHNRVYEDPFFDVTIDVVFTSPSKRKVRVGGFHYGSSSPPRISVNKTQTARGERRQVSYEFDKQNLWKARFAPSQVGKWKYSFVFRNAQGKKASGRGSFTCIEGRRPNPGFIRQHPTNPFRFVFDDGSAYFPIGLQDCWGDGSATGSALD
ncbi:MAG TPA: DUF5060 domain-containing protein, partial [Phycisphaerales bacterium]|nr:DUF5060 domain-containing protein [Phycisphaerales bacterium]